MPTFVLTVLGDDRPGLVDSLSGVVAAHHGNWERSQMARLGGKFAGGQRGVSTQNSLSSGSAMTTHSTSPWPMSIRLAPNEMSRSTSAC